MLNHHDSGCFMMIHDYSWWFMIIQDEWVLMIHDYWWWFIIIHEYSWRIMNSHSKVMNVRVKVFKGMWDFITGWNNFNVSASCRARGASKRLLGAFEILSPAETIATIGCLDIPIDGLRSRNNHQKRFLVSPSTIWEVLGVSRWLWDWF